jgi:hypothetical protein
MNTFYNVSKVALVLLAGIGFISPAFAESTDKEKPRVELNADNERELEFYDYHSGVTHTSVLHQFLYHSSDRNSLKPELTKQESANN